MLTNTDSSNSDSSNLENYSNGVAVLDSAGFVHALLEVSASLSVARFNYMCTLVTKVVRQIAHFVNCIKFNKDEVIVILDPVFDFGFLGQLSAKSTWKKQIDCTNLYKGWSRLFDNNTTVSIVKPVIWSKEGKA